MFNATDQESTVVRWFTVGSAILWLGLFAARPARGQVSSEEHQRHHPDQSRSAVPWDEPGGLPEGISEPMGGMMEQMGAPKPKDMYPALMDLPDLPMEKRAEIEQQAHQRMVDGTALLSAGLDELSAAAATDDFQAMQAATAKMREGLAQFESGLAAHRAIAEGKAPRNVALQWFKREMNLLPPAASEPAFHLWGMDPFHTAIMALLVLFAASMIWLYFFKMRRAALLLQDLIGGSSVPSTTGAAPVIRQTAPSTLPPASASQARANKKWSGKLRISQVFQETPDTKTFRLMNPLGGELPFEFLPGQFLTVCVPSEGKPVKRSYTIASSPTQNDYAEITVKHAEGGIVSGYLHESAQVGDLLECTGPSGAFIFTGRECKCILLIGAGVGITPLMSVLRYLTDRSWAGDIFLIFGCSTPKDIIFREEIDYLQGRHPNLRVVITVSHPEGTNWKGPAGRITEELIAESVPDLPSRYVHICGPVPMMEAVKKVLSALGIPSSRVKTEAFGPALGKPEPTLPPAVAPDGGGVEQEAARLALPTVTFSQSDKSAPLPPDKAILDVADEIGVDIDNSCRVGTCGICRVKLLSGSVTMAVVDGLEPGDKEAGIILACQAKATANIAVDA